jgi:REP-associated tyrosine transposase
VGRELRVIDPTYPYHVFCRGSNRGPIVFDEADCDRFVGELDRVAREFEWKVYAWCLLPNHHHVIVQTARAAFSAGFQQLNGNHSRRTNLRHGRSDHLFRNRPGMVCCESPAHLVGAIAYVVRNPLTAGLVDHPGAWRWSSYRATMGLVRAPKWLCLDEILDLFGATPESARSAFDSIVHLGHPVVSDTI